MSPRHGPVQPAGQGGTPPPKPIRKDTHLVGRRMWILARDRERWRLSNIAYNTSNYWPRGVYEADCEYWQNHTDRGPSPHPSCHCGMYGFWNIEELAKQYHPYTVTGTVFAWGQVLPGNEGFKAQYMMPIAVDYPMCMGGAIDSPFTAYKHDYDPERVCGQAVEYMVATSVEWAEEYPIPGDEDWEIGYEWVNCRVRPKWYCAEHADNVCPTQSQSSWRWPAWKVFADLSIYYELEVWPPYDFPVKNPDDPKGGD